MYRKLFLISAVVLIMVYSAIAEPSQTADSFPNDGLMQPDYTYQNAATYNNLGVYDGEINAIAEYENIIYSINFNNVNEQDWVDGTIVPENYTIETATINLPSPAREEQNFGGWYENEQLNGESIASFTPNAENLGDKEFWAKWDCPEGYYSPVGFADQCYPHILHVGEHSIYLKTTKTTTPSLNIKIGENVFYANMTTTPTYMSVQSQHYMPVKIGDTVYYICDDTTYDANAVVPEQP